MAGLLDQGSSGIAGLLGSGIGLLNDPSVLNFLQGAQNYIVPDWAQPQPGQSIGSGMVRAMPIAMNLMAPGRVPGQVMPMMAAEKGLGSSPMATIPELDAQLANALKGTDLEPMDMVSKYGQKNAPQAAKDIWAQREQVLAHADKIDVQLEKALKPHDVELMDIALRPDKLSGLPDNIKALWAERMRLLGD